MSKKKSGIWSIALPLSVVFLAAAYYVKVPEVRKEVDAHTPVVRNLLGRFVQETGVKTIVLQGEQDPAFAKPKAPRESVPAKVPDAAGPMIAKAAEPVVPAAPPALVAEVSAPPVVTAPDLQTIAADRTRWPKKVSLIKAATFPAVLNGKVVGSLVAPAGAEANLVSIKEDQVGLEFNGGGAWVPASQTDLIARIQAPR
jgi:hypothetical protein